MTLNVIDLFWTQPYPQFSQPDFHYFFPKYFLLNCICYNFPLTVEKVLPWFTMIVFIFYLTKPNKPGDKAATNCKMINRIHLFPCLGSPFPLVTNYLLAAHVYPCLKKKKYKWNKNKQVRPDYTSYQTIFALYTVACSFS